MWRTEPTEGWRLSAMDFQGTHPKEMSHLLRNLSHFLAQLRVARTHRAVEALYLHKEAGSIIAIDQNGMEDGLIECRLYVFPDEAKKLLYLLCVGKASSRDADLEYCRNAVLYILNEQT